MLGNGGLSLLIQDALFLGQGLDFPCQLRTLLALFLRLGIVAGLVVLKRSQHLGGMHEHQPRQGQAETFLLRHLHGHTFRKRFREMAEPPAPMAMPARIMPIVT